VAARADGLLEQDVQLLGAVLDVLPPEVGLGAQPPEVGLGARPPEVGLGARPVVAVLDVLRPAYPARLFWRLVPRASARPRKGVRPR
jgi:hypothetical protein